MIERHLKQELYRLLDRHSAVVLVGPRQVGKTTLGREIAGECGAAYVDLECGRQGPLTIASGDRRDPAPPAGALPR